MERVPSQPNLGRMPPHDQSVSPGDRSWKKMARPMRACCWSMEMRNSSTRGREAAQTCPEGTVSWTPIPTSSTQFNPISWLFSHYFNNYSFPSLTWAKALLLIWRTRHLNCPNKSNIESYFPNKASKPNDFMTMRPTFIESTYHKGPTYYWERKRS